MADEVKQAEAGGCGQGECGDGHCGGKNLEGIQASAVAKTLKQSVADSLAASGQETFDRVRDYLVEEELKRRADLLLKGLAKKSELERDIRKVKPDQQSFDATNKLVSESYSKGKAEELKRLKEQLAKIEKALEAALNFEKPCFDKLGECVGK